jgi:hypothetical protein
MVLKLLCIAVGSENVASVDIDAGELVSGLKAKTKKVNPNLVYFNASLLRPYVARDRDGKCLTCDYVEYNALK